MVSDLLAAMLRAALAVATRGADVAANGTAPPQAGALVVPGWVAWAPAASASVAVFALALSALNFFTLRRDRERDRRLSVVDQYWFRVILGPFCVEPVFTFVVTATKHLRELSSKKGLPEAELRECYRVYVSTARGEIADLVIRLRLLAVVDKGAYEFASKNLDSVEDALVTHCSVRAANIADGGRDGDVGVVNERLMALVSELGSHLIRRHRELS